MKRSIRPKHSRELPDAELSGAGLKITPLENSVPKEADALRDALYRLVPHVKITDLLMEVDRWTGFTRHFVHLKSDEPVKDQALWLTALLADATNLGLGKMAESCPGTSRARLSWLVAWHIRDETYSKALAERSERPEPLFRSLAYFPFLSCPCVGPLRLFEIAARSRQAAMPEFEQQARF